MLLCGIDIGTTNTKAVVVDEDLSLLANVILPLPNEYCCDRPAGTVWLEQFRRPIEYFDARGVFEDQKVVCGITTQGGSFTCLDNSYKPVTAAFSWTGFAEQSMVDALSESFGKAQYYRTTGLVPGSWLAAVKLKQWLEGPDKNKRSFRFAAGIPELIFSSLAGKFITDFTNAQITGMFDFNTARWSEDILDWVGISPDNLAETVECSSVVLENVDVSGRRIDLVTSCHDQYSSMYACGLDSPRTVAVAGGTAWVINGKSRQPFYDFDNFVTTPGRDVLPGWFGYFTSLGQVGRSFARVLAAHEITLTRLNKMEPEIENIGPGKSTVPGDLHHWIVSGQTDPATAVRRFMEAVAAHLRFRLEVIAANHGIEKIIMTGGAAQGRCWPRILSNVCNIPVQVVRFPELTAYGAALLTRYVVTGRSGDAHWPDGVQVVSHEPEPKAADAYEQWYGRQREVIEQARQS